MAPGVPPTPCRAVWFHVSFLAEIPRHLLEPATSPQPQGCGVLPLGSSAWDLCCPEPTGMRPDLTVCIETTGGPQGSAFLAPNSVVSLWGPMGSHFHTPPRPFLGLRPGEVSGLDTCSYVLLGTKHTLVQKCCSFLWVLVKHPPWVVWTVPVVFKPFCSAKDSLLPNTA